VKRLVAGGRFSGVVAVATNGTRWFGRAYGRAVDVDQRFSLASMSKMFTAVAIAQLAQQRKIRFDDPIARHLPEYPWPEVARRVTIEQLLTHTGGLGDFLEDAAFQAARAAGTRFASAADYLQYVRDERPAFEPGSRFLYSNSGYVVLGAIIERVSGLDYYDYIVEHVLRPAGMRRTDPRGKHGSPAGSAISTAGDLVRFAHALQTHRLLDAGHTKLVLAPRVATPFGNSYALGFFVRNRGTPERIVGHDGESESVHALLDLYIEDGHAVVVLADLHPPAARNVASKLETLLLVR
jgi:CubicO group peptidase (beta-lactamase class C family)